MTNPVIPRSALLLFFDRIARGIGGDMPTRFGLSARVEVNYDFRLALPTELIMLGAYEVRVTPSGLTLGTSMTAAIAVGRVFSGPLNPMVGVGAVVRLGRSFSSTFGGNVGLSAVVVP